MGVEEVVVDRASSHRFRISELDWSLVVPCRLVGSRLTSPASDLVPLVADDLVPLLIEFLALVAFVVVDLPLLPASRLMPVVRS